MPLQFDRQTTVTAYFSSAQFLLFAFAVAYIDNPATRGIHPMLFRCWTSVEDGGPTLKQHWVNASCLLEKQYFFLFKYPVTAVIIWIAVCTREIHLTHIAYEKSPRKIIQHYTNVGSIYQSADPVLGRRLWLSIYGFSNIFARQSVSSLATGGHLSWQFVMATGGGRHVCLGGH